MTDSNQIIIASLKNDTVAVLKNLPVMLKEGFSPGEEEIKLCLEKEGITHHVNWKAIMQAIAHVKNTGEPIQDVIIGRAEPSPLTIFHCGPNVELIGEKFNAFKLNWRKLELILNDQEKSSDQLKADFYLKDEIIFEVGFPKLINLKGKVFLDRHNTSPLEFNDSINVEIAEDKIYYKANENGYLIIDENKKFGILDPVFYGIYQSHVSMKYYSIRSGIEKYQQILDAEINKYDVEQAPVLENCTSTSLFTFLLKKGISPVKGIDAMVDWKFTLDDVNDQKDEKVIDYKELNPYKKIEAGTLIAVKSKFVLGREGEDINGEKIKVKLGTDIKIKTDKNITSQEKDGKIYYKAGIGGIYFRCHNSISIENALVVRGDVDLNSGNISQKGSVIIEGDVKSGFSVKCENNLVIRGSIENGGNVSCSGDVIVMRGVVGENTILNVRGSCQLGFVADAEVICVGKLEIEKYAYNARLYCRDLIEIHGVSVKNGKSALIGGEINSLGQINVHSVGSLQGITNIELGYDLIVKRKIAKLKSVLPSFSKILAELNKKVLFISGPDKNKILDAMSPEEKAELMKDIKSIKDSKEQREKIEETITKLGELLKIDDISLAKLTVKIGLLPDVQVTIKDTSKLFTEEIKGAFKITMEDFELVIKR